MYINFDYYNQLLQEADIKVDSTKDAASTSNKFSTRPQGILIQDTFNNPFFPINPRPKLDTSKLDIIEVYKRYRETYSRFNSIMLPWHFCVEMIEDRYVAINTRPLDMRFPIDNKEALTLQKENNWDEITELFFDENIFDISEGIHVAIIGDTNSDVYPKRIYEVIGRMCILPTLRQYHLPGGLYSRVFGLNLFKKFNLDYVTRFIRK